MTNGLCTGLGRRDGVLHLELRSDADKHTLALTPGDEVAVELVGARECIGCRPPGQSSLVPCPAGRRGISSNQCPECFAASLMLPCLRCDGERCQNPARRKDCVQPENHAVYLAAFAPGMLKVGTARWDRRAERVAEQGARAAIIISRDDGQQVHRVEAQIKRLRGDDGQAMIPDKRNMREKLDGLTLAGSRDELERELRAIWPLVRPRIIGSFLDEPESVELPDVPLLTQVPRVLQAHADLRLRGVVEQVSGQTLILDSDSGERVAFDVGGLVGYRLRTLAADEAGVGQLALAF